MEEQTANAGAAAAAGIGGTLLLIDLVIIVLMVASLWKIFAKAGQPGWAAIVPIYNVIVMLQVAKKPLWWIALLLVPIVNLVVGILVIAAIANSFGKGGGFVVGMIFLPIIFYPILAFGSAQYQGGGTPPAVSMPPPVSA